MGPVTRWAVRAACLVLAMAAGSGCMIWGHRPQYKAGDVYELAGERFRAEAVAEGLHVPWSLVWTPQGQMLIAQRSGQIVTVQPGNTRAEVVAQVPGAVEHGEGGLMGLVLSPGFAEDRFVYVSYTRRAGPLAFRNVIARFRLAGYRLTDRQVLVDDLPAAEHHNGLPLRFGPDGKLYASTGEATHRALAQRTDSLAGKFLRMDPDGTAPEDNPFPGSPIWSLGHRDCQGFDWQPGAGRLYADEHGPTFPLDGASGRDEINLVVRGGNYGWPKYRGDQTASGFEAPLWQSGSEAIAPARGTFYRGGAFSAWRGAYLFATLHGESLYVVRFSADDPRRIESLNRGLQRVFGRLRVVAEGPDGSVYLATSNRDGHGLPAPQDDRVFRLVPIMASAGSGR